VLYSSINLNGIFNLPTMVQPGQVPLTLVLTVLNITNDGGSGITVGSNGVVYFSCISGPQIGFFKSTDGGVNWTQFSTPLASGTIGNHGTEQDLYYPRIDPYNAQHLLMTAHEQPFLFQSFDGGQTWANLPLPGG